MMDTNRRRLEKEDKVVTLLLSEEKTMKETLFNMQYQLVTNEIRRENRLRMKLVREREIDCAIGLEESCDLYYYGFHNDQELIYEGIPAQYNVPRTRPQYQHTEKEKAFLLKLNGLERIRASLCLDQVLLPDESPRIFGTVGEYMTFHYSDLKKEKVRRTMQEIRRDAMFGAYTESEDFGWLLLGTTLTEAIGIVASPLTIGYALLVNLTNEHLVHPTYVFMEECVNRSSVTASAGNESCGVSSDEGSETCTEAATSESFCSEFVHTISKHVVDSQTDPGSIAFIVLMAFELDQYSEVSAVLEFMNPVISTLNWMSSVMVQAPFIYYDYYIGHNDYVRLPPTRNACLLRSGLEAGRSELQNLKSKIKSELVYQQEKVGAAKKPKFNLNIGDVLSYAEENLHIFLSAVGITPPPSVFSSLDLDIAALTSLVSPSPGTSALGAMDPVFEAASQFCSKVWGNFMRELSTLFGDHTAEYAWLNDYEEVGGVGGQSGDSAREVGGRRSRSDMDFGRDKAWELLYAPHTPAGSSGTTPSPACISKTIEKYDYELCFFDTVKQGSTILGRFDRWESLSEADSAQLLANSVVQEPGEEWLQKARANAKTELKGSEQHLYNLQRYDNGAHCFGSGKSTPRSVNVHYYCGTSREGEILAVRETEMCKYDMLVSTAFACQDHMEKRSLQLLDELGVFGFGKKTRK